ncbi:hypothetical protein BDF19DRAFT_136980 [Syncephalis fuscata]|nr:hypothetical protein BDF19DRAFT_136980 [Syncephalis fuscata]
MDLIERVIPGTSTLWYPSNYSDGRSVDQQLRTVISILPLIEHGLRRYWVDCNQLPIERCCTANSTQFYSILDDILASPIRLNEDTPPRCNLIANRLTESVTNFLMDLFLYSRGPRLRDRLAHGELNWLNDNVSSSDIEPFFKGGN